MVFEIRLLVALLAVLTGSTQIKGQTGPPSPTLPPPALQSHAGGSAAPRSDGSWPELSEQTVGNRTSGGAASISTRAPGPETTAAGGPEATAPAAVPPPPTDAPSLATPPAAPRTPSAPADALSPTLTWERSPPPPLTTDALAASSPPPEHAAPSSTLQARPGGSATPTERPPTPPAGPTGPTHRELPAQLNVGDEDIKPRYRMSSPLDPLLAGLLSVFIVTTAIVFITLFFRFRQRTNHPEFHRLQDLPMDDLMEDTPLSRYTY